MCPSLAQTCSWPDIYGNTTTYCGFHPQPGPTLEGKRQMTVASSWKVMTRAPWRSTLKDAIPQVAKHQKRNLPPSERMKELCGWRFLCFFQCVWSWTCRAWRWTPSSSHSMSMTWRAGPVWVSVLTWSSRPRWRIWWRGTREPVLLPAMMRLLSAPTPSGVKTAWSASLRRCSRELTLFSFVGFLLSWCLFVIRTILHEQDLEEHGGWMGPRDYTVPQCVCRQPGDALLPLAALAQLSAVWPRAAPHPAQHDEEGVSTVSATSSSPAAAAEEVSRDTLTRVKILSTSRASAVFCIFWH